VLCVVSKVKKAKRRRVTTKKKVWIKYRRKENIKKNIPVGRDFCTRTDQLRGPPSLVYNGYRVIPGVKRLRHGVNHPYLAPKLKKE
jgi:hypothetical protein